jgi:hypothetical protein
MMSTCILDVRSEIFELIVVRPSNAGLVDGTEDDVVEHHLSPDQDRIAFPILIHVTAWHVARVSKPRRRAMC